MTNLRYAIITIGALSLLLGLSLGQINYLDKRVEQLEFNRFRQAPHSIQIHSAPNNCNHHLLKELRENIRMEELIDAEIRRYNKQLHRWERNRDDDQSFYFLEE